MAPRGHLRLLNEQLNTITIPESSTAVLDSNSPDIKFEDVIDPTGNRFICAECGGSFHKIAYLVHHYTRLHTQVGFSCPIVDCGRALQSQANRTVHVKTHGQPGICQYPGCTKEFPTWGKFFRHLDAHPAEAKRRGYRCLHDDCSERFLDLTRLTQHTYQTHPGLSKASGCLECRERFQTDQELCGHYRTLHPFVDPVTLICPAPDCSQFFSNTNDLYRHYETSRHPAYIPNQVPRHLMFKCPFGFCARVYASEIALGIHNALAHGSEIGGLPVLELQSINSVIASFSNVPESSTNQQGASEHPVDPSIEGTPRDAAENVVEIDEQGAVLYRDSHDYLSNDAESDETADASFPSSKRRIGFVQEGRSNLDEPGAVAHDRHERGSMYDHSNDETDFPNEALARTILLRLLLLLHVNDNLSVDELLELWIVFLQPEQRGTAIQQLKKLNFQEEWESILARIRGTLLGTVISAWIRFKALLEQTPTHLRNSVGRRPYCSARDTAWAILMHCMLLEDLRQRAIRPAFELGFLADIPDRLRFPSTGLDLSGSDATFAQILDALAERVRCRRALAVPIQVTNLLVLDMIPMYVEELKEAVLALYPGHHDSQEWYEVFGPG